MAETPMLEIPEDYRVDPEKATFKPDELVRIFIQEAFDGELTSVAKRKGDPATYLVHWVDQSPPLDRQLILEIRLDELVEAILNEDKARTIIPDGCQDAYVWIVDTQPNCGDVYSTAEIVNLWRVPISAIPDEYLPSEEATF